MSTSCLERPHRPSGGASNPTIIAPWWRWAFVLVALWSLSACNTLRLSYNQGPTAAYWWLDRYVDFNESQSPVVRQDLKAFWEWHRRQALPVYQARLERWKNMAAGQVSAEQVCREFEWVQSQVRVLGEQGTAPMARWALTLQPDQLARMQTQLEKRNEDFVEDYLEGDADEQRKRRLKDNRKRWTQWYGSLSTAQLNLLEQQLAASAWDAAQTLQERRWRQADLLKTVRAVQSNPDGAASTVAKHLQIYNSSSTPEREAQRQQWVRTGCTQFAALHNSMGSSQRAHAQAELQGYIDDLIALTSANKP
jgi:hypothetical protein